jgi:hypothetical protein
LYASASPKPSSRPAATPPAAAIASASAEQANAGYSAINLGLNLLNSFVKPREK